MKKLFGFAKKKKGFSPNTSETGSVISGGYELKEKNLGKLHKAASTGDLSKTRQLVKKHDVNQLDKENRTPLHLACANGHTDVVSFLVESNSKLNLCDNDNRSPLMKAVQCQQERCATILLEHYADPNLVDINGNTALHLAALIPTISLAAQLLEHDAHINAQNKEGCTPLFLAVTENHQEMVEFLLKEGADINATDKSKRTPLMIAASSGQISMIKLLLRYDADIAIKDDKGWTADDYAVINGHHACSHLIIEHGTKKKVPQSPPYYGTNKMKGVSMFSSPDRVPDIGFTLGGPATDREELQHSSRHNSRASDSGKVADDLSQADSGSRASDQAAGGDSWLSSDEDEELDLSLKKPPKVSLAKLMNASQQTKKNVNENINIRAQAVSLQQSKSDSEEDSHQDSEEEDVNNKSPPKPLSPTQTSLRPAIPLPGSFSKAPQMTSSPLHGFNKGESSEKNEQGNDEDGENEHRQRSSKKLNFNMSCAIQNSSQIKGSSETVKRDLMLELGLEEVDGGEESEFAWDSESVSESPKEPPVCHLSPVKTQMKKSSVPEEQNQDTFYIPSFIRRSRDYKMTKLKDSRNVGKPVGQMGTSEESRETQSKANLSPEVQKVLSPKEPSPKETVQSQNPDASDWDSTTTSNKNIPLSLVPANHLKSDEHQSEPLASTPKGEKPYMQSIAAEPKSILLASEESNCPQNATVPPASSTPLPKPRLSHSVKENQAPPQPSTLLPAKQKNEQESGWDSEAATLPSGLGEPGKHGLGGVAPAPYNTEAAFKMFQASGDGLEYRSIDKEKQVEGKKKSALQEKQRCEELENIKDQRKEDSSRQVEQMTGKAIQQQMSQWPCPKGSQLKNSSRTSINTKGRPRPMQNISKRIERVSDEEDQEKNQNTCEIMKQTGFHLIASNRQTRQAMVSVNGDPLTVFDDSTLSEISQDEGRTSDKISNKKNKLNKPVDVADDFDDLTQSSDTATEDLEQPTSAFRNAMLLIEQLNTETIDSVSLLKIQTMVHEYERALEREKSRYALQSEKVAQLENERKELQGTLEETREMKSVLEHKKVEWETDINSLKFTLKQEEEKCKNAEMLYEKSREQLQKKEDQYCREVEAKQQLELTMRNLEMETRALINNMKQVEEERNEAQRLLSQERSARALQEGILNNHLRKQQEAEESKREATKCSEALAQQKEIGEREKELVQQNRTLQEEMLVFKLELDRVRARNQEEESLHLEEKEMLKEKVEDLKGELKLSEEALTQTVFQYNGQLNTLKTESAMLNSRFEHEKQSKEKLETEVESVRSRLTSALQEVERCQAAKSDAERTLQRECDEWLRLQEKRDREISSLRETIDRLSQKLSKVETKANGLENELHCATLSVTEKTLLLESSQRDLHQSQSRIKELEHSLQAEKDQLSKHVARQESMHERLAQFQSETTLLRQQLEDAQNKGIIKEKVVSDVQDRFSDIYTKLREDSEKQVRMVEERNKELNIKNNDLREQVYKYETEKTEREGALRQLQQELADALKKLSMSEASLEVTSRCRSDLEEEKLRLQKDTDKLRSKLQEMEEQCFQSERRIHELKNALDDKEREVIASSQKLQEILSASSGTDKTLKQLEDHVQRLEIENAKLEAAAKQQANRSDVLQKELQESASVRNRLEDMVTSLQAAKINLEEQLNQEVQKQTVLSQSAQGSHNLWEEELKSRSKLGLRLTQLDREKTELTGQVETEKKKVKKVAELKRSVEMRLDQEMKRNGELQKEIIKLRTLVKTAKRKLRERDSGELAAHLSSFRGELHHRHLETEGTISKLQVKVDALSQQLESELTKSTHLESTNRELREQLSSMKTLHKNHERLERSKRQLEEEVSSLKCRLEASTIEHSQIEQYKREVEERARQEIRQKLEEVNLFLQTQAASQEALEQIKATNEASLRNQLEQKIRDLESELNRVKSNQQDSITQRESAQTELERYRELYTEELKLRKSLAAKLDRSNERLAEANTKLLDERQRNKSLIASSIVNGSLTASPALDASQLGNLGSNVPVLNRGLVFGEGLLNPLGEGISSKSRVEAYLTKMQHELERNITKELDQATIELDGGSVRVSPVGSAAGSLRSLNLDQDSATRATQQYLEVLKKNYMI
nr:PREDICTED: ankyrin repeat domain-containing protein 26-like isoform X2 [Latimeria chalumnae]|eukprot:XP_014349262.1 PREDICTED: ankyrin repeat domain-containing protein 26-like isoform X2 [Latimeria chalumnae]